MAPVAPFMMKVGDRLPAIQRQLLDGNGSAVDISQASYVKFALRPSGVATVLLGTYISTIVNASLGIVEYDWGLGETSGSIAANASTNYFQAEFEVMWPGSRTQTFPNQAFIPVVFMADIV